MTEPIDAFSVSHYRDGMLVRRTDSVVREVSFSIYLNKSPLMEIACAGIHLKELAVGFLHTEGLVEGIKDLKSLTISESPPEASVVTAERNCTDISSLSLMSSGARKSRQTPYAAPLTAEPRMAAVDVLSLMNGLLSASNIHERTGGTHCAALACNRAIIALREDIGRHNTIDMCIGYSLLEELKPDDKVIVTTGRISSEIVGKVWRYGAPVIISHSAPTSKAIDLADQAGITLIGYVRDNRMRVYTHERRVVF